MVESVARRVSVLGAIDGDVSKENEHGLISRSVLPTRLKHGLHGFFYLLKS